MKKTGGKIIVISFHSIEDRIVKFFFTHYSKNKSKVSRYQPQVIREKSLFENYRNKIIRPDQKEIDINLQSRSAKLRFATRSKDEFFYPKELKKQFNYYLELENRND